MVVGMLAPSRVHPAEPADRARGLSAAAQRAAPGAADHRHRRLDPAADLAMMIWDATTWPFRNCCWPTRSRSARQIGDADQVDDHRRCRPSSWSACCCWYNAPSSAARCAPSRENPRVAGLMGVNPNCVISATFVIGSGAGRHCRRDDRGRTTATRILHGLHPGPEGVHGRGAGRHRQPRRRDGGRRAAGPDRTALAPAISATSPGGVSRQQLPGHVRLHRADHRARCSVRRACWANAWRIAPERQADSVQTDRPSTARTLTRDR